MSGDVIQLTEHFALHRQPRPGGDRIACACCGAVKLTDAFWSHLDRVEQLRADVGFGLRMTCGHRCPKHNAAVGGAEQSVHLDFATDLQPWDRDADKLAVLWAWATEANFDGMGLYNTFVHLDSRALLGRPAPARWDRRTQG